MFDEGGSKRQLRPAAGRQTGTHARQWPPFPSPWQHVLGAEPPIPLDRERARTYGRIVLQQRLCFLQRDAAEDDEPGDVALIFHWASRGEFARLLQPTDILPVRPTLGGIPRRSPRDDGERMQPHILWRLRMLFM